MSGLDTGVGGWLFQCSPRNYRIFDAVRAGTRIRNWAATQHSNEIQPGDNAALWIGAGEDGYPAGVYATGTVRSLAFRGNVDQKHWTGDVPEPHHFIDIDFDQFVFHHPIAKDELKRDPDFAKARIIRMPRGTNFLLTPEEWSAIERRMSKRRPTPRPRLTRNLRSL
jgi:hypothetical protein